VLTLARLVVLSQVAILTVVVRWPGEARSLAPALADVSQELPALDAGARLLLDRYRDAAGGASRLTALNSFELYGTWTGGPSPQPMPFVLRHAGPRLWQLARAAPPNNALGPVLATGIDGDDSWVVGSRPVTQGPVSSNQSLSPDAKERLLLQRRIVELAVGIIPELLPRTKLATFSGAGKQSLDGRPVDTLIVSDVGGSFGTLFLDAATHLPIRFEMRFMMLIGQPSEGKRSSTFSAYKRVEGISIPHEITAADGRDMVAVTRFFFNPVVPSDLFRKPTGDASLQRLVGTLTPRLQ